MPYERTIPATEDPNVELIEATDNGLRPEDGDQLINGLHVADYTDAELMAMAEEVGDV